MASGETVHVATRLIAPGVYHARRYSSGATFVFAHPCFWEARGLVPAAYMDANYAEKSPLSERARNVFWIDVEPGLSGYNPVDMVPEMILKIGAAEKRKKREAAGEIELF